ncbi:MAG: LCP family protein [Blautia sp.]|nr:LCP family protein [Lachnoclostridium sp.]MCM1211852.1 LCP family protein [Blautia sp.]
MLDKETIVEKKKFGVGTLTVIIIITVLLTVAGILTVMRMSGKASLSVKVTSTEMAELGEESAEPEEKQILYKDDYVLNEDLVTILVMGIDKETVADVGGQSWEAEDGYAGGQADALFLMLINPHDKNVYVIAINRNAMAQVDVFDEEGNYQGIFTKQIALQHGYGDGGEESCLRQVKAVSRMFHNIPINAYAAISMDAIPELNDLVGGITVEVLDDIIYPEYDMDLHQGDTVTLLGEKAYWYVRLRNENVFNSNELRLQRQKQYMTTFAAEAKNQSMSDIRVAINLYQTVRKYMVTDIDLNEFTYMATEYIDYDFDRDNMYSLTGEAVQGNNFEEFYVDEDALEALILELFYEPA